MSSPVHEDLSPARFRPSPIFVTTAFALIGVAAVFAAVQPLLAARGPDRGVSAAPGGGDKVVDAQALPRRNLLGSLFVVGAPEPVAQRPAAPKPVAIEPGNSVSVAEQEAPPIEAAAEPAAALQIVAQAPPAAAPQPAAEPAAAVPVFSDPPY